MRKSDASTDEIRGYARIVAHGSECSDCGRWRDDVRWCEGIGRMLCRECLREAQREPTDRERLDDHRRFMMGL